MSDVHNSLRLGDLLVEKGLITRPQLRQAIEIQQALQTQRFGGKNINGRTELGEILIELGFISRHQLQSNLNWQRRLKATTAVMVFIAPLLTAACGGGAGGSTSTNTGNVKTDVASSLAASPLPKPDLTSNSSSAINTPSGNASSLNAGTTLPDVSQTPTPTLSSASKVSSSSQSKISSSSSSSSPKAVSSASSSKLSSVSSSKISSSSSKANSSSSKAALSSSSKAISSSAASSSSRAIDGSVQLLWNVPNQRENGDYLDITEIGGYELRYKLKGENTFKSILIKDGFTDAYYFQYLKGDYEFQIATFDNTGIYSAFVNVNPS